MTNGRMHSLLANSHPRTLFGVRKYSLVLIIAIASPFVATGWSSSAVYQSINTFTRQHTTRGLRHFDRNVACLGKIHDDEYCKYELAYSPNFNRHLVVQKTYDVGSKIEKRVVRSFEWLDEAQEAYPTATLKPMDLPPPPPSRPQDGIEEREWKELLSRIVAGAGLKEESVYYCNKNDPDQAPNNGGSYLLRFLQKLYSSLPTLTPAEVHRGVMDKFPRLAFYDSSLVHERLFFLLSPLPPEDVLVKLRNGTKAKKATKRSTNSNTDIIKSSESEYFDDFPVLFFEYGYGAGFSQAQLIQALQTIPQFWLPIYFSDASCASKKPQELLPYIFYHLNAHPELLNEIRAELDPLLAGVLPADVACLAHAKSSLRLSLDQCRVLLHALPTTRSCDIEPSWEFYERGPIRSVLEEDALIYLRLRLQLTPSQVYGLLKTHTRLSTYSVQTKLKPTLDALQSKLGFTSKELQQVILRMPSLMGVSTSSLDERIDFFTKKAGMTMGQLRKSILRIPALSQYAIPSLEAKFDYFHRDLEISNLPALTKVFVSQPVLWGLSLDKNLKPTASALGAACSMSLTEVGDIVARAPELLLYNWDGNLRPKIDFLVSKLNLSPYQLNTLVMATPRVLVQSIHNSLTVKIEMLESKLKQDENASVTAQDVVLSTPSLLLTNVPQLQKRLEDRNGWIKICYPTKNKSKRKTAAKSTRTILQPALNSTELQETTMLTDATIVAALSKIFLRGEGGKYRNEVAFSMKNVAASASKSRNEVLEFSPNNTVLQEFPSVKDAAAAVNITSTTMYAAIRTGRLINGKRYAYRDIFTSSVSTRSIQVAKKEWNARVQKFRVITDESIKNVESESATNTVSRPSTKFWEDIRRKRVQEDRGMMLLQSTHRVKDANSNAKGCCLVVYVSGRIYPPDEASEVRGKRRAGGMAIAIRSLPKSFSPLFKRSCENCFSSQLLSTRSCNTDESENGRVALLGYPYLRPSRRRCSLYVCREALRVVRELFLQVAEMSKDPKLSDSARDKTFPPPPMHIHVVTDSNYAFDLLHDVEPLLEWGSKPNKKEFAYTGEMPEWAANTDILYPLCRTYFNLAKPEGDLFTALQGNLTVNFMLDTGIPGREMDYTFGEKMGLWAREAAQWQYERSR